ncbi:MAG: GAF domain-containing protein [Anaerolineae bacterium]|nr:GAF domain-containing protein [Anaerolineae bacterium]
MKIELTKLELPLSVWQSLHWIDNLLGQALPWDKRLEEISHILIDALKVEAIWLLTVKPLSPTACGLVRTPLATAPEAKVQLIDKVPSLEEDWPSPNSLLCQVIAEKKPCFMQPQEAAMIQTDSDLGDAFFHTLNTIPAAIVPLVAADQPVGALIIGDHGPQAALSEKTQHLLAYLGEHVGANLYNAYLVEHSQRHAGALRGLNSIAQTITSSLNIDEVLQRTMAGINHILEVEAGSLLLVDEETNELYFKITLRGENRQITAYRLQPGEGIAGWVVANNRPVISNNAQADKRFTPKIDQAIGFTTNTVLCVPLIVHGKPIGALEVINKRRGSFNKDDQELLISMAASLGIALKNADLYQEAQARARRTEMINQVTSTINTGHGLSETGKLILAQFSQLLRFDHISISILDKAKENIRQWVFTEHGSLEYTKSVIPATGSLLAQVIKNNQPRLDQNLADLPPNSAPFPDDQILREENIKSRIAIPLTTEKSPYGLLNVGHRLPGVYGPAELHLLEQLMPQVAVTIEKSWLIHMMEQHNLELRGLNHLSEMLFATTNFKVIIDTAVSMLPRLLPGDVQGVMIAQKEGAYLGVVVPFDFSQTDWVIADIMDTFNQISENDVSPPLVYAKSLAGNIPVPPDWQAVSVFHLPILTRLGTLGLIYVASAQKENLGDQVWRTFSLTAAQISAAAENAYLFQQVEQERARLAAILASSTDAVLVVNRDGQIVLDNPTAWQVMGVSESQQGKPLAQNTSNEPLVTLFASAMSGGNPTGEIPLPDNRTFYANLSPVAVGEAGVIGWVATMQDVSHFAELSQLKDEFVSTVSHDLRSPLSAILIATNLIPQTGPITGQQQELLTTIEDRVDDIRHLIDALLDVGKIEAGIDMDIEPCQLPPLLDEVTGSLTPQANHKSIQLNHKLSEDLLPVMANPTRIRQVLHNLIDNAIKYTPPGGQVTVKAFQQEQEIRIQVIDTGIGIPAADQPHVFEKFYQVKESQAVGLRGSGLGLAITKSIVEKCGGRIWLESVPGKGSTFTVALPVYLDML